MRVLGIETSCDETAAAVVDRDSDGAPRILSNIVLGQMSEHERFGGVVPELAARAHLLSLDRIVRAALEEAALGLRDISAVAATAGPGLVGGLLVGMTTAKAIAVSTGLPFIAVNHLEGHALTVRLTHGIGFPYLLLLVSGGHTQIIDVRGFGHYGRLATTIDDALGEAFDKTAKLLGLGFPGGPLVEAAAANGDAERFSLPRPLHGQDTLNFSFSGLKTAVRIQAERLTPLKDRDVADLCASFQKAVADIVTDRASRAMRQSRSSFELGAERNFVAAGGVAANRAIRQSLEIVCRNVGWKFIAPPLALCGDNAAMIAWAGLENLEAGRTSSLGEPAHPRWPLDGDAPVVYGSGKRGAKA